MFYVIPFFGTPLQSKWMKRLGVLLIIFSIISLVIGIANYISASTSDYSQKIHLMSETSKTKLETGMDYYIDEMMILDCFASDEDNDLYCLSAFHDKDGDLCVAPIKITTTDSIYEETNEYLDGDEFLTYITPAYVFVTSYPDEQDLKDFQKEVQGVFVENGYFTDKEVLDLMLELEFEHTMTMEEAAAEYCKSDKMLTLVFVVVFVVLLVLGYFCLVKANSQVEVSYEDRFKTRW